MELAMFKANHIFPEIKHSLVMSLIMEKEEDYSHNIYLGRLLN